MGCLPWRRRQAAGQPFCSSLKDILPANVYAHLRTSFRQLEDSNRRSQGLSIFINDAVSSGYRHRFSPLPNLSPDEITLMETELLRAMQSLYDGLKHQYDILSGMDILPQIAVLRHPLFSEPVHTAVSALDAGWVYLVGCGIATTNSSCLSSASSLADANTQARAIIRSWRHIFSAL